MKKIYKSFFIFFIFKFLTLPEACSSGFLAFHPNVSSVIQLTGQNNSFFITCLPYLNIGKRGRMHAKNLSWQHLQKPPMGNDWVTLGVEPHERIHVEQSADRQGLDLVFRSIQISDDGRYACLTSIDGRQEKREFSLKVLEPISFKATAQVQSAKEGAEQFTLICNVSGIPQPKIVWNVKGQVVKADEKNEKYECVLNGLVIKNVVKADAGSYKCKAIQVSEGIADFKDFYIRLKVEHKPYWPSDQLIRFFGYISGVSNLTCEAMSEPAPSFTWFNKHNSKVNGANIINLVYKSILQIKISHDDIFGDYSCVASNRMGSIKRVVKLIEGAKPGIPTVHIMSINHKSVDMWIEEHKAEMFLEILGFQLEYKQKKYSWENATKVYFEKNGWNRYRLEHLKARTYYHVRAFAVNLAGVSDSSNLIFLQTNAMHTVGKFSENSSSTSSNSVSSYIHLRFWPLFVLTIIIRTVGRSGGLSASNS